MARTRRLVTLAALAACGPQPAPEDMSTGATATTGPDAITTTGPDRTTTSSGPPADPTTGVDGSTSLPASTTEGDRFIDFFDPGPLPGPPIEPFECPLDWPATTMAAGMTPSGPRTWVAAGFGETGGECGGTLILQLVEDHPQTVDDLFAQESLFIEVHFGSEWQEMGLPFPGTGPAHFSLRVKGFFSTVLAEAVGEITITALDPAHDPWPPDPNDWPRAVGEFVVAADVWDIAGQFEADFCGNLDLACP